jgi:hypothetical protein
MKEPKRWLCLYEIHIPQYDQKTFRAILSFTRQNEQHGLLLGGDALDRSIQAASASGEMGNKDLPGNKRKGELKADLDGFDKQILQPKKPRSTAGHGASVAGNLEVQPIEQQEKSVRVDCPRFWDQLARAT